MKRRIVISLLLLALSVPIGIAVHLASLQRAHRRIFDRAMLVIHRNEMSPPAGETLEHWRIRLAWPHNIMHNFFVSPKQFPTENLAIVVARLEALWPDGLKSVSDTGQFIKELEKAHPATSGYIRRWIENSPNQ